MKSNGRGRRVNRNHRYGKRREGRWTPTRAKAQDTRASPYSLDTHLLVFVVFLRVILSVPNFPARFCHCALLAACFCRRVFALYTFVGSPFSRYPSYTFHSPCTYNPPCIFHPCCIFHPHHHRCPSTAAYLDVDYTHNLLEEDYSFH